MIAALAANHAMIAFLAAHGGHPLHVRSKAGTELVRALIRARRAGGRRSSGHDVVSSTTVKDARTLDSLSSSPATSEPPSRGASQSPNPGEGPVTRVARPCGPSRSIGLGLRRQTMFLALLARKIDRWPSRTISSDPAAERMPPELYFHCWSWRPTAAARDLLRENTAGNREGRIAMRPGGARRAHARARRRSNQRRRTAGPRGRGAGSAGAVSRRAGADREANEAAAAREQEARPTAPARGGSEARAALTRRRRASRTRGAGSVGAREAGFPPSNGGLGSGVRGKVGGALGTRGVEGKAVVPAGFEIRREEQNTSASLISYQSLKRRRSTIKHYPTSTPRTLLAWASRK